MAKKRDPELSLMLQEFARLSARNAAVGIGVDYSTLYAWARGAYRPPPPKLIRLSEFLRERAKRFEGLADTIEAKATESMQ